MQPNYFYVSFDDYIYRLYVNKKLIKHARIQFIRGKSKGII